MFILPGADVHLLLQPAATPVQLRVLDDTADTFADIAASPAMAYTSQNPAVVTVNNAGRLTPVSTGSTFVRLSYTGGATPETVFIRVSTHTRVQEFWIANNRATLHARLGNYILSVFAQFDDGAVHPVGDISQHAWVRFRSLNTAVFTIDAEGRIAAGATPGLTADAEVTVPGQPAQRVPVFIRERHDQERRILHLAHGSGILEDRRNLLLLAEGYTVAEEEKFLEHAVKMIDEIFLCRANSPFHLMTDAFNVWTAFLPSPESGVTLGNPVLDDGFVYPAEPPSFYKAIQLDQRGMYSVNTLIRVAGLPDAGSPATLAAARTAWAGRTLPDGTAFDPNKLTQIPFDRWREQRIDRLLRPRDSFFGYLRGGRLSDPDQASEDVAGFFIPNSDVFLRFDWRRRAIDASGAPVGNFFEPFLETLRFGEDTTASNFNPSTFWVSRDGTGANVARDRTFVAVLVNEVGMSGVGGVPGAITVYPQFRQVPVTGTSPRLDHDPSLPPSRPFEADFATSVFVHELGHLCGLHEEYEGGLGGPGKPTDPREIQFINRHPNAAHRSAFTVMGGGIDPESVPWNWERIKLGGTVRSLSSPQAGAAVTTVVATLALDEGSAWKKVDASARPFLRSASLRRDRVKRSPPLRVVSVAGDAVTLQVDGAGTIALADFPRGSALLLAKTGFLGKTRRLILPAVAQKLASSGFFAPQPPGTCNNPSQEPEYPPPISGFAYPRNRPTVIAAYEGGANNTCDTFRPTGYCKMRKGYQWEARFGTVTYSTSESREVPFCYVCKYAILHLLKPGALAALDAEYPEDC